VDKSNYKAHYFIGKILVRSFYNEGNKAKSNDAILHFEQVIKHNFNEIYTSNALFEIALIKIKEKDFYY
jgi:hypothetical protein